MLKLMQTEKAKGNKCNQRISKSGDEISNLKSTD